MYILTDEDKAQIEKDIEKVHSTVEDIKPIMERWANEHTACVGINKMVDATWNSLINEHPALMLFNAIQSGEVEESVRLNTMIVYLVAYRLGLEGYQFLETPCSQDHPDHLHDVEDVLSEEDK